MKKIEAVIRRTRFEETKEALLENGVEWFSYVDVRGSDHARNRRVYRGVMYETDIIERMMLIQIVRDELCDKAIDTIIRTARTGEIGDVQRLFDVGDQVIDRLRYDIVTQLRRNRHIRRCERFPRSMQ